MQMAHAVCQTCRLLLVEASSESYGDLGAAVNAAVAAGATEVSNSYGGSEGAGVASFNAPYEHAGVVVTVSSGDCGYLNQACHANERGELPGGLARVVAVGGTYPDGQRRSLEQQSLERRRQRMQHAFGATALAERRVDFAATGCGSGRSVADVSAVGDPYTGVDVYDSTPAGNGDPTGWTVLGGTSASSPIVAAEFALAGGAHGVANPSATLYAHIGDASALYDVTSGSNGSCARRALVHGCERLRRAHRRRQPGGPRARSTPPERPRARRAPTHLRAWPSRDSP